MFKFLKNLFVVGRCCGDCKFYSKCWNNKYDDLTCETPACDKFSESDSYEE